MMVTGDDGVRRLLYNTDETRKLMRCSAVTVNHCREDDPPMLASHPLYPRDPSRTGRKWLGSTKDEIEDCKAARAAAGMDHGRLKRPQRRVKNKVRKTQAEDLARKREKVSRRQEA